MTTKKAVQTDKLAALERQIEELTSTNEALQRSLLKLTQSENGKVQSQLRLLIDSIPTQVSFLTPAGDVEFINGPTLEYTGRSFEELEKWGTSDLVHPDDLPKAIDAFKNGIPSRKPFTIIYRMRRHDGLYRWFDAFHRPLADQEGRIVRWCVSVTDIDDRKRLEDTLRESERNWRSVIDGIPGLVATLSPDGNIEAVNRQIIEYTGQAIEDLRQWGTNGTVHPDDMPHVSEVFLASIASGQAYDIEQRLRRFDGAYRWFGNRAVPVHNADGTIARWYVLLVDIDDRKRAEDKVRESDRQSMMIVNTIPGLVAVFGPAGEVEDVNQPFLDYLGQSIEEFANWPTNGTVHPDDVGRHVATLARSMETGQPIDTEARLRRSDGLYRWFQVRGHPARDRRGQVVRWYCLMTDVDDQKQTKEALSASEQNLQLTVDTIPALAWSTRPDGWADFFNRHYQDFVGLPLEQLLGVGWAVAVHPDDMPNLMAVWQGAMASGQASETEARLRRHDGAYRWFLFRANPLRNQMGEIVRWYGVNTDIEDWKRAEAELRRSHDSFAAAQRLSKTGNFTADVVADDHIWSEELYRIFEIDPNTKISVQHVRDVVHAEDLPVFDADFLKSATQGIDFDQIFRIVLPSGVKHVHAKARVIERVEGRPVFIGAIRDVTDAKVAEESLNRTRSELAHVARVSALSALTASIAHEVNQPLSGIITNASTGLRMLGADPPDIAGAIETARRTLRDGHRAADVITRLRGLFSRKPASIDTFDLNEATREVVELLARDLQRSRLAVHLDLHDGPLPVAGDRVQIQQVIVNLVRNASDAMSEIVDRPRDIVIRTGRVEDGAARFVVKDVGIGLDPQTIERLFDALYTTKHDGMGIGLSVSRSIIEGHGGKIWAEPNEGPGATFAFSVPRRPTNKSDGDLEATPPGPAANDDDTQNGDDTKNRA